ncbi:MAG: hypothetical protein VW455_10535 [Nitrospinota bacterium]
MKKFLSIVLSIAFLSAMFVGSALCEPHKIDENELSISDDESKKEESILEMFDLDEAEAHPSEKGEGTGHPDDEILEKGDDLPLGSSDDEDEKFKRDEDEKENPIL